jgi:hypothetical protein
LWWVPAGKRPTLEDGVGRLDHLKSHGPSDYAFGWPQLADAELWKTQRGVKAAVRPLAAAAAQ